MKSLFIILFSFLIVSLNAQNPYPSPKITLDIKDNKILEDNFEKKYMVNDESFKDTISYEQEKEKENFFTYINGKNYRPSTSSFLNNSLSFYTRNSNIIRMSFYNKETQTEMNIYLRFSFTIPKECYYLTLKGLSFQEGNYLYDMCHSHQYNMELIVDEVLFQDHSRHYGYSIIEFTNIQQHKITKQKLRKILEKKGCLGAK